MRRSEGAIARRVDDEVVILNVETGRYFALNETGAAIWDRLEKDCTVTELVAVVVAAYDVDEQQATGDVEDLVRHLADAGLVEESA